MKSKIFILFALLIFLEPGFLYANTDIEISGMKVALMEDAVPIKNSGYVGINANVAEYVVYKPLNEVIDFYESYFKANDFLIIGGLNSEGNFEASVKKSPVQFSLRIYSQGGHTKLQFIW